MQCAKCKKQGLTVGRELLPKFKGYEPNSIYPSFKPSPRYGTDHEEGMAGFHGMPMYDMLCKPCYEENQVEKVEKVKDSPPEYPF